MPPGEMTVHLDRGYDYLPARETSTAVRHDAVLVERTGVWGGPS